MSSATFLTKNLIENFQTISKYTNSLVNTNFEFSSSEFYKFAIWKGSHSGPYMALTMKLVLILKYKFRLILTWLKFIYSEKATKFCKISIVDLTVTT